MKQKLLFLIFFLLLSFLQIRSQTYTPPTLGDGTSGNPYQIATLDNLYWLSQNSSVWSSYFKQISNIDASSTSIWDSGKGFTPIGKYGHEFTGHYNGNGYTISGLTIKRKYELNVALFANLYYGGTIDNLRMSGCSISGNQLVASMVGCIWQGTVNNCSSVSGNVTGYTDVGGLIGLNQGNCKNSYVALSVSGTNQVGGLAGYNLSGDVSNCYAMGSVTGSGTDIGGLVGCIGNSNVLNCYATGSVSGGANRGGLVGFRKDLKVVTGFYNKDIFTGTTIYGTGKTTAELKVKSTFVGWDFKSTWSINGTYNNGYPAISALIPTSELITSKVSTQNITNISSATACANGILTEVGLSNSTECGFVWNTSGTPTLENNKITAGMLYDAATFTATIPNLTPATTYYVCSYSTNAAGTSYGSVVNFTTEPFDAIPPSSGIGSVENPYQITNIENLYWISINPAVWSSSFIQTADIYARASAIKDGGHGWLPIGNSGIPFNGKYNGQGHSIFGLTINRTLSDNQGLFGYTSGASISNLGLSGESITGGKYSGGLVGTTINTTINNCYSIGNISGTDYVGGLIGNNSSTSTVNNSYAAGLVNGTSNKGGLMGANSSSAISDCFYDSSISGLTDTNIGNPKTTEEMKTQNTFANWDFNSMWSLTNEYNNGYPCFLAQIPLSVRSVADVQTESVTGTTTTTAIAGFTISVLGLPKPTAHGFVWNNTGQPTISDNKTEIGAVSSTGFFNVNIDNLTANTIYYGRTYVINAAGITYSNEVKFCTAPLEVIAPLIGNGTTENPYQIASLSDLYWLAQTPEAQGSYFIQTADIDASATSEIWLNGGWTPIGNQSQFSGHYDGKNHTILGLTISGSESQNQGLFGMTFNATISNLGLIGVNINGNSLVGSLVGFNTNSSVSNCYATGNITSNSEFVSIGGLIGCNQASQICKSYSTVEITANGSVAISGGLVGKNIFSPINDCYAIGNISANGTSAVAGGLIGNNDVSSINRCYAAGKVAVTGEYATSGGLVAIKNNTTPVILNSFYDTSTTGQTDTEGAIPMVTAEMKTLNTYKSAGWDFKGESANGIDEIWNMNSIRNNGYPFLNSQYIDDPTTIIYYVDSTKIMGNINGSSWEDAFTDIQPALDVATAGSQIWVAKGTYQPTTDYGLADGSDARLYHFRMKEGVSIFGGFSGTENPETFNLADRDYVTNPTILSGDLGTQGDNTDNAYHLFFHPQDFALTAGAVLDGFVITGANADGMEPHNQGGGMYNSHSSPTINNVSFRANSAADAGGGLFNTSASNPVFTNVTFLNNSAGNGGGIYNSGSSPIVTNVTFTGNSAVNGGALYNNENVSEISSPILDNCIVWGNTASASGKEFYINSGTVTLNYSCYGNQSNDVLNLGTFTATNNNINENPCFFNIANGNYTLANNSPCINTGNNSYNSLPTDIAGKNRIKFMDIDMGAYENQIGVITSVSPLTGTDQPFTLKTFNNGGKIMIQGEVDQNSQATLIDMYGRIIGMYSLHKGNINSINSTGIVPGIYLLRVTSGYNLFNKKLIIN